MLPRSWHRCGYEATEIERVQRWCAASRSTATQAVEDAACLVFIETQLGSFAARTITIC